MKSENINNYYTDEDLIHFKKLKNFSDSKENKLSNDQGKSHSIRYATSDNKHFDKIMNNNKGKSFVSKKIEKEKKNNYYSLSDFENFKKIKQFATFNENKTINKNTDVIKSKTKYTLNDVDVFDQIIKSKGNTKKYDENMVSSKVDSKKIKIIDFNKLKEREKNLKNKVGIEKIKIVYFD